MSDDLSYDELRKIAEHVMYPNGRPISDKNLWDELPSVLGYKKNHAVEEPYDMRVVSRNMSWAVIGYFPETSNERAGWYLIDWSFPTQERAESFMNMLFNMYTALATEK